MQAKLTTKPVHEVVAAIQALDLESVKLRAMDAELGEGWTREYADSIEIAYKNYLMMLAKYQDDAEDILLSKDVDEFWHTHILQTMKYAADCEKVFGNFLHHDPHVGERTAADMERRVGLAEKTRRLYQREFGTAQIEDAAWSNASVKAKDAAWSNASIKAKDAAWSNASVKAKDAAWSNASIKAKDAAWSNAAIKAQNAAWSNASTKAENAAWSNASIKAKNAAWSNASIKAKNAAWSNASIKAENAAWSNASIKAENAAWSNASIKAENAAWSNASIKAEKAALSNAAKAVTVA